MPELVVVLVALAGAAFVAAPLFRREPAATDEPHELGRARELQSRHDMLVASLRDLEEDHRTDKIDEADYAALYARLATEAVDVMRRLDQLAAERQAAIEREHPVLPYPGPRRPAPRG